MSLAKCQEATTVSRIKVEENRKQVIFLNLLNEPYLKVRHDGCMVRQQVGCDWVVSKSGMGHVFIELKGKDIKHATEQILAAVEYWTQNGFTDGKVAGLIIGNQYPRIDTQIQRAMQIFSQKYKGKLKVYSRNIECQFGDCFA